MLCYYWKWEQIFLVIKFIGLSFTFKLFKVILIKVLLFIYLFVYEHPMDKNIYDTLIIIGFLA